VFVPVVGNWRTRSTFKARRSSAKEGYGSDAADPIDVLAAAADEGYVPFYDGVRKRVRRRKAAHGLAICVRSRAVKPLV